MEKRYTVSKGRVTSACYHFLGHLRLGNLTEEQAWSGISEVYAAAEQGLTPYQKKLLFNHLQKFLNHGS